MFGITNSGYKTMFILIVLGTLGYFLGLPYLLELAGQTAPILDIVLSTLLNMIVIGVMVFFGYIFGRSVGLGAPIISAKLEGKSIAEPVKSIVRIAPLLGVFSGIVVGILDVFVFVPLLTGTVTSTATIPSLGSRIIAMFYGGFYEEILLRFMGMSFVVWLIWKLSRTESAKSHTWIYWAGIIIASVLLGVGHLPAAVAIYGLTPLVVTRELVLNLVPGLIFSWLYWKQGIESAMTAHLCADFTIHVVLMQIILAIL